MKKCILSALNGNVIADHKQNVQPEKYATQQPRTWVWGCRVPEPQDQDYWGSTVTNISGAAARSRSFRDKPYERMKRGQAPWGELRPAFLACRVGCAPPKLLASTRFGASRSTGFRAYWEASSVVACAAYVAVCKVDHASSGREKDIRIR